MPKRKRRDPRQALIDASLIAHGDPSARNRRAYRAAKRKLADAAAAALDAGRVA